MEVKFIKRNIFQRLLGLPTTRPPSDEKCWTYRNGTVTIDLARAPELSKIGGAIRLEKKNLPERILVIRTDDGRFHAFLNKCKHMGRRLDPVPDTETIQCCSVNKTTYDFKGEVLFGPAKKSVQPYPVTVTDKTLEIKL
ncbi:MAG: Rieske 2Fe-2S domain-containing protein [Deltaproteobacteria bacterium]|nr:Rieske 2Fe-2S domain-containing protein [Deltaproteobacteria bacterium]